MAALCLAIAATGPAASAQETNGDADGETVTFADVLADPDNVEINFQYARQQIAAGNLLAASSALERILITHPNAHRVRLLYGIVLYRLGNTGEAAEELQAVNRQALAPGDRQKLAEFRTKVRRAQRDVTGDFSVTLGTHYDTNRNNFPAEGEFQVNLPGTSPTTVQGSTGENADIGRYVILDGKVDIATAMQRWPRVTLAATGVLDDQVEEDDLDLASGRVAASALYVGNRVEVAPRLTYRHMALDGDRYLRNTSGRLRVQTALGSDRRRLVFVDVSGGYEDYSNVAIDAFADEKDGRVLQAGAGFQWTPVGRFQLTGRYQARDKTADADYESYFSHKVTATARYVLVPGLSLSARGQFEDRRYDGPDPFVSNTTEQTDQIYVAGGGAAIAADRFAERMGWDLPQALVGNLMLNLSGQHRRSESNFPNFEYNNTRVEVSLTKRLTF